MLTEDEWVKEEKNLKSKPLETFLVKSFVNVVEN